MKFLPTPPHSDAVYVVSWNGTVGWAGTVHIRADVEAGPAGAVEMVETIERLRDAF